MVARPEQRCQRVGKTCNRARSVLTKMVIGEKSEIFIEFNQLDKVISGQPRNLGLTVIDGGGQLGLKLGDFVLQYLNLFALRLILIEGPQCRPDSQYQIGIVKRLFQKAVQVGFIDGTFYACQVTLTCEHNGDGMRVLFMNLNQ